VRHVRWWLVVFVTALVLVGGGITALAASGGSVHPRLVAPPGALGAGATGCLGSPVRRGRVGGRGDADNLGNEGGR
jgi:hypothetical protein